MSSGRPLRLSLAAGTGWNGPRGVLGAALVSQYEIDGDPATLDEAIDLLSAVVRETPRDASQRHGLPD